MAWCELASLELDVDHEGIVVEAGAKLTVDQVEGDGRLLRSGVLADPPAGDAGGEVYRCTVGVVLEKEQLTAIPELFPVAIIISPENLHQGGELVPVLGEGERA